MSHALVPHAYLITAAGQASLNPPQDGSTLQDLKEDVTNNYFEVMPGITMTQTPQKRKPLLAQRKLLFNLSYDVLFFFKCIFTSCSLYQFRQVWIHSHTSTFFVLKRLTEFCAPLVEACALSLSEGFSALLKCIARVKPPLHSGYNKIRSV